MRFVRHPFFELDVIGIVDHVVEVTQGVNEAGDRRLDEVDVLLLAFVVIQSSGLRL